MHRIWLTKKDVHQSNASEQVTGLGEGGLKRGL